MSIDQNNNSDIFNLNPLPSWIFERQTYTLLDVNLAALDLYGYTKEEFLNLTLQDLRPKEEIPKLLESQKTIHTSDKKIDFGIFTHKKKNGERIKMSVFGQKIIFSNKKCMLVVCQDITQQQKYLAQLEKSQKRLNTATNIAKLGYWNLNIKTNKLNWSDEVYQIWEKKEVETDFYFDDLIKTIHPDDLEFFLKKFNLSIKLEGIHDVIHRIILPDNSIKWVHQMGRVVKDQNGNPSSFEGTVQDITSQKNEEQRLKLLESVITNTQDAILITQAEPIDEPGPKIIFINEAFSKMSGYTYEEVVGKSPRIFQGKGSDRKELERLKKAMKNWEPCEISTINYKKNGEEYWVNFTITPVANANGWYTHWISIQRDVTKQKQEELQKKLLEKIIHNFKEEVSLVSSTKKNCETIAHFGNFDFVEIWLPNIENNAIYLLSKFENSKQATQFYDLSATFKSFKPNEGLQGIVWQKNISVLWSDVQKHKDFVRKEAAKNAGIASVLGIPLFFKETFIGVLVIGTQHKEEYLKKQIVTFEFLQDFIGTEINRKKLENDLTHLYDAIPDLICITNLEGKFLKINKAGCQMIGYDEDEILQHTYRKFVHPEDINISDNDLDNLNHGKNTRSFENRYITKSGEIIWLSWTSNTSLEEGLIYASAKNITQEKKLRELNQQATKLSRIGSWEIDLLKNELYWSDMVHKIHESDPESYTPDINSAINLFRKDFQPIIKEKIENAIETGKGYDIEAIKITHKNNERWIRTIANVDRLNGVTRRIYGSFQDIHERKINEIKLQESLKKLEDYKFALDQSASITIADKNGIITEVNDNFCKLSKYSRAELIGRTHKIINSKYHSKAFFKELWDTITAGKVWRGEVRNKAKDGSVYWALSTVVPFLDKNNQPFQYMAIRIDITEKKKVDKKILNILEEKNNILESIGDAFFAVNKNWRVTYWNKQAEILVGKKREEILGEILWNIFNKETDHDIYVKLKKSLKKNQNLSLEIYSIVLKKWVEIAAYPNKDGLSVYFKDISERKASDFKLIEAKERFEKVAEATSDAIYEWNIVEDLHYWGAGFETILGYDLKHQKPSSKLWLDQIHPEDVKRVRKSIFDAITNPNTFKWEEAYRFIKKDGTVLFVVDKGIFIKNKLQKVEKMFGSISDVTKLKKQERDLIELNKSLKKYAKELELSNKELEEFAFIASHDLQEPLRMITSFMDLLQRKYQNQLDEKGKMYIHFAMESSKKMRNIILDLLEYSRAGKTNEVPKKIAIGEIVKEYQFLRKQIILDKNVQFTLSKLPVVECYKSPLIQTIHSLIDNAIKYSRKDVAPCINIFSKENNTDFTIYIQDNGIGIDPKFHDKIFVIFKRLHNKETYEGNGIGLAITKKHVESWGGKIKLTSKLGEGSSFYFTIPKRKK